MIDNSHNPDLDEDDIQIQLRPVNTPVDFIIDEDSEDEVNLGGLQDSSDSESQVSIDSIGKNADFVEFRY